MAVQQPDVVVFDVNETLSDLAPMADRFAEIGLPPHLVRTWFASLLRDGFAATAAGHTVRFAVLADHALRAVLGTAELTTDADSAVRHVLSGFGQLPLHGDVPDGVRALRANGMRLVTLTNGASAVADQLLTRGELRSEFSELLSVEDASAWKPAPAAYDFAARSCAVPPDRLMLVASHPWDIDGAARAGLRTAWINRTGATYPDYFAAPELTARGIDDLGAQLSA